MQIPETIIFISWGVFLIAWALAAFNVKKDIKGGVLSNWSQFWILRVIFVVIIVFVLTRIGNGTAHYSNYNSRLSNHIFLPSLPLAWLGALFAASGIAFAVWARIYLGKNWSPAPRIKENHELVVGGPYAYVRHPIYTGVILAAFGTVLSGTFIGIFMFIFSSIIFLLRIKKEEKIMLKLFPNEYPAYQARTKKLIPYVW